MGELETCPRRTLSEFPRESSDTDPYEHIMPFLGIVTLSFLHGIYHAGKCCISEVLAPRSPLMVNLSGRWVIRLHKCASRKADFLCCSNGVSNLVAPCFVSWPVSLLTLATLWNRYKSRLAVLFNPSAETTCTVKLSSATRTVEYFDLATSYSGGSAYTFAS